MDGEFKGTEMVLIPLSTYERLIEFKTKYRILADHITG